VKLFISYARLDGADLAQRLKQDLSAKGADVWRDKERLRGGDPWRREIEVAIDGSGAVVAVVSKGSNDSEVCRAELASQVAGRMTATSRHRVGAYAGRAHGLRQWRGGDGGLPACGFCVFR
jgi:hypothetical protein